MPFISVSDEVSNKSFTSIENKFITKYMPVLEPMAVKVYLYSLFITQSGQNLYTVEDLAKSLEITEEQAISYFEYLEEFELISITSRTPFEVKILDAENVYGTPKKYKTEKYADFTKAAQNALSGRMISPNEFREYFYLIEEYGFEQNALLMIINYCVNLKGNDIRSAYIKKVAKSFAEDSATTVKRVEEKLSGYTSSTPALLKLFSEAGIRRQPDIYDDKLYKKWTDELGFEENAIIAAAKFFKVKNMEKLDVCLEELYKLKKFDVKEIEDYCKTKNSVYALTIEIAKNLGVYIQNPAPYVENYVSVWYNYGYSPDRLIKLAAYSFKQGKNSFEDMNGFISELYNGGIVDDATVDGYIIQKAEEDKTIKEILSACGLSRKIIDWDRQTLNRWKSWNFNNDMILEAAHRAAGKSNPLAYMNAILSSWKADNIFNLEQIPNETAQKSAAGSTDKKAEIERHYFNLRNAAEARAEAVLNRAESDQIYGEMRQKLNELNIKLAFAELKDKAEAEKISKEIAELEKSADERLKELGIDKRDFVPDYSCKICGDTGYKKDGAPCECLERFIKTL